MPVGREWIGTLNGGHLPNQTTQYPGVPNILPVPSFSSQPQGDPMSLINTTVQPFKAQAFHNGKFVEVTEQSLKGHWSVLIFMPAAFTFNCPTEIEDAADNYAEFQKAGAEVYIVTTDTHFSHKVWHETSPAVGKAKFPLVGDPTHALTNAFGVHIPEEGLALRGTFVINPDLVIKTLEIHSNEIARDVSEIGRASCRERVS
jgi:peroxiredoxin (alkyl hydroperoxide reductase subunit C)